MLLAFILGFIAGMFSIVAISSLYWMVSSKKKRQEYAEKILEENK